MFRHVYLTAVAAVLNALTFAFPAAAQSCTARGDFNDSHFHLTNYVQEGIPIGRLIELMGERVPRSTLFGIPLQQQWSYRSTGDFAPRYYLDTNADLYYYSFTDAFIAEQYRSLPPQQRARLDPMITGFNPADMYAADHIRRVLMTYPGVFTGIGEFSVHKEFVTANVAGESPSLLDPALDRVFEFAGEAGLIVILHNDIVMPFARPEYERVYFDSARNELAEHPNTSIIWAHMGLGRVVSPPTQIFAFLEEILSDPRTSHINFDISWDEVAKYVLRDRNTVRATANLINRYPDRFLFGTDWVAPDSEEKYYSLYEMYRPLWRHLTPAASANIRICNYERLFDAARARVRAWEAANVPPRG
jgi:hypothetical protein